MKKITLLSTLVIVLLMASVVPAAAGYTWCSTDPVVILPGGQRVNIYVSVPEAYSGASVTIDLWVPRGAKVETLPGPVNVSVVTHSSGKNALIIAAVHEDFPVALSAVMGARNLGGSVLHRGKGIVYWTW